MVADLIAESRCFVRGAHVYNHPQPLDLFTAKEAEELARGSATSPRRSANSAGSRVARGAQEEAQPAGRREDQAQGRRVMSDEVPAMTEYSGTGTKKRRGRGKSQRSRDLIKGQYDTPKPRSRSPAVGSANRAGASAHACPKKRARIGQRLRAQNKGCYGP